jgi:hypothetical protein
VGDDDDGEAGAEVEDEFLDFGGGDGVEGGAGLIHEEDLWLDGDGAGDAEALLLAAGEAVGALVKAVFDFVPEGGGAQAFLDNLAGLAGGFGALEGEAVGDVVGDGAGEGVGLLEDHADAAAEGDGVDVRAVDILVIEEDATLADAGAGDAVVHAVEAAEEGGFAAAGGADESGDLVAGDDEADLFEGGGVAVGEVDVFDLEDGVGGACVDLVWGHRSR